MASVIEDQLSVEPIVAAFLASHGAHAQFLKVCDLVRQCFPDLVSLRVTLQEDPDEVGRAQAVLCANLPDSLGEDRLQASLRRYHQRLVAEVPLADCPLFALVTDFVSE